MKTGIRRRLCASCIIIVFCIFLLIIAGQSGEVVTLQDRMRETDDRSYVPDKFGFSGGTGRVTLSCPKVSVRDGQAYASLVFDSGSYSYVKAGGKSYEGVNTEDTSTFEIPVRLNQNNTIVGCTTKMSAAHEITYRIFVYIEGMDGESPSSDLSAKELSSDVGQDKETHEIPGLTFTEETETEYAEYFRIFRYEGGITCIEVQNPYDGEVLRYLIAPAGTEFPAGTERETTVIRRPNRAYVASEPVLQWMDELELWERLALTGIKSEDCKTESVGKRLGEEEAAFGGSYDNLEYKMLVKESCDLVIMPAGILKAANEEEAADAQTDLQEKYEETTEYCRELDIPVFVDLSSAEQTAGGRLEWSKAYGIIFGCEDSAEALYHTGLDDLESSDE